MASFRLEESRQESKNASIVKVARKVWEKHRLWDTAVSQSVVSEHIRNKLDKKTWRITGLHPFRIKWEWKPLDNQSSCCYCCTVCILYVTACVFSRISLRHFEFVYAHMYTVYCGNGLHPPAVWLLCLHHCKWINKTQTRQRYLCPFHPVPWRAYCSLSVIRNVWNAVTVNV